MYTVISVSDDGVYVTSMPGQTLKERLAENYWGPDVHFFNHVPSLDPQEWGPGILIIKGDIVVPQPVQTVTEYKL